MLAVGGGLDGVLGVMLVGRSDVDGVDCFIGAKARHADVGPSPEFPLEARACLGARVRGGDELHTRVRSECGQHERESAAEAGDTESKAARGHQRSITISGERARDTQIMIWVAFSSSMSTRSRWSASPETRRVRQVPQVPLSHELGASWPRERIASRIDAPGATSMRSPELASTTVNARSSGLRAAAASMKLSKWIAERDQCPVMSRTASSSGRGPQQ